MSGKPDNAPSAPETGAASASWHALLPLLRCPVNHQPLTLAPQAVTDRLNAQRETGALPCEAAETGRLQIDTAKPLEAVLLRSDRQIAYVVQSGVPVLLPDHGMRQTETAS